MSTGTQTSTATQASGMDKIKSLVSGDGSGQNIPLIGGIAIFLIILCAALYWASSGEYRALYSNLSESDGGKIVAELERINVPYKLTQGGNTIMVPSDQVYRLRLQMAESGLPAGGNVGFELIDNQGFGVSNFAEHVNYQRGLEGELSRSIESMGIVSKARVHLVLPKNSVFARDRQPASASVILHLNSGREMAEGQIDAIAHMVASSVQNLPVDAVTVVDQSGKMLTKSSRNGQDLDGTQLRYIQEIEASYQQRIENVLYPIFGAANVRAQIVAQIDFNKREQTAERYSPNQPPNEAALRSQQIIENYSGGYDGAQGVPGALTNSPPYAPAITTPEGEAVEDQPNPVANASQKDGSASREQVINYEVDRTVEHVQFRTGALQRLSAAVVVNYKGIVNDEGEVVPTPLTEAELDNINRLVRVAMGYSDERGDRIEVINTQFSAVEPVQEDADWWKTPEFLSLVTVAFRYLLVAFIALLAWMLILRPIRRRQEETKQAAAERLEQERIANMPPPSENMVSIEDVNLEDDDAHFILRRRTHTWENNKKAYMAYAKNEPKRVAAILNKWITQQ